MALGSLETNSTEVHMLRQRIDDRLAECARFGPGCPPILQEAIEYCLLAPGKRLRPLMVLLANQACGGRWSDALGAACAVEMVHAYSLVHDDLPAMDDDDVRRGKPTCHIQYDEATAILVGDALLTQSFAVLASSVGPADTALQCIQVLASAAGACQLIGGQADDLATQKALPTIEELESIHLRKTAAMFSAAAHLGGLTAGADVSRIARLSEFGRLFGLSFQIIDDLLDHRERPSQSEEISSERDRCGHSNYNALSGMPQSRQRSKQLTEQALACLADFGLAAEPLRDFVAQLIDRTH